MQKGNVGWGGGEGVQSGGVWGTKRRDSDAVFHEIRK